VFLLCVVTCSVHPDLEQNILQQRKNVGKECHSSDLWMAAAKRWVSGGYLECIHVNMCVCASLGTRHVVWIVRKSNNEWRNLSPCCVSVQEPWIWPCWAHSHTLAFRSLLQQQHIDTPDNTVDAKFDFTEENYKRVEMVTFLFYNELHACMHA
jgi:hypothetical protein